ncbi:MAG: hypothetical protein AAGF67_11105 [Verrucomicrobiota bacterium]
MKPIALVCLILLVVSAIHAETFTNAKGVSLEAEIRSYDPETDTVVLHVTAKRQDFPIPLSSLAGESQARIRQWYEDSIPKPAEWVEPGATKNLEFAELGKCNHDDSPLNCNVYVPTNYAADQPVPLLVWLTGGKGGNNLGGAYSIAGKEDFVCVSLPYPQYEGRDIFDRQRDDGLVEFWAVHKVMLDAVSEAIPNLDPKVRIIAGFSNGAHSIGGYCSQVEDEFGAYFNAFVFGDGGVYSSDWSRQAFRGAHAYVCWGEVSENKDMGLATVEACESARMIVTESEMADTGHKFTDTEKAKVQSWIHNTVVPERRAAEEE